MRVKFYSLAFCLWLAAVCTHENDVVIPKLVEPGAALITSGSTEAVYDSVDAAAVGGCAFIFSEIDRTTARSTPSYLCTPKQTVLRFDPRAHRTERVWP
jgi:hypothetical protein